MRNAFAKALRKVRKARGLTQEDFSLVSSRTYISTLERGKKSPTLDKMQLLSKVLGIHPLSLLTQTYLYFNNNYDLDKLFDRIRADLHFTPLQTPMIRVLITDDHAIMREGLKQLLGLVDDIAIAGEATDGPEAIARLDHGDIDLLLLDMSMPGLSGKDLIAVIRSHHPDLPILVLSMHLEPRIARSALDAGANGYVTKDRDPEALLDAIRHVATGGSFIDPKVAGEIDADFGY